MAKTTPAALEELGDVLAEVLGIDGTDSQYAATRVNLAEALLIGLSKIATQVKYLGLADAATPMGALEMLGMEVKEGSERIAAGLEAIADAIREHGDG